LGNKAFCAVIEFECPQLGDIHLCEKRVESEIMNKGIKYVG
jgi:hypothetical protein